MAINTPLTNGCYNVSMNSATSYGKTKGLWRGRGLGSASFTKVTYEGFTSVERGNDEMIIFQGSSAKKHWRRKLVESDAGGTDSDNDDAELTLSIIDEDECIPMHLALSGSRHKTETKRAHTYGPRVMPRVEDYLEFISVREIKDFVSPTFGVVHLTN